MCDFAAAQTIVKYKIRVPPPFAQRIAIADFSRDYGASMFNTQQSISSKQPNSSNHDPVHSNVEPDTDTTVRVYAIGLGRCASRPLRHTASAFGKLVVAYETAEEFLEAIPPQPVCVCTELLLPGMSGLDLLRTLRYLDVVSCPVVLTEHASVETTVSAMRLGANVLLQPPFTPAILREHLLRAINMSNLKFKRRAERLQLERRMDQLSHGEKRVLEFVVEGMANREIASRLDIGLRTVELRRHMIAKKLQAKSLAEVVTLAVRATEFNEPL